MFTTSLLLWIISVLPSSSGFIGYDCASQNLNVTTLSLLDVDSCELPPISITTQEQYIELLQVNTYKEATVTQCKIEVHRTVYHCGMFSHISVVIEGENNYIKSISREACLEAHKFGHFRIRDDHIIDGLRVNNTVTIPTLFAGNLDTTGKCKGATFSDPYGTWENVVVQGTVTITLSDHQARINLENNKIHLRSGTACPLTERTCMDRDEGNSFWEPVPKDICKFDKYTVLYRGIASKMTDYQVNNTETVYSISSKQITFALMTKGVENLCGYNLITTEHPQLIVFETNPGRTFASNEKTISNLDNFLFMNSKFLYIEKHIRTQIKNLYRDVLLQKCNLERQTLKNSLSIAMHSPDEFAYDFMKKAGYMAVVAGEVIHLIECLPVEVQIQQGTACYAEIQVSRNNKTYFMSPRTHILKGTGTEIPCSRVLPVHFFLSGKWYKVLPFLTTATTPNVIKPETKPTWEYEVPANLATSGIYSQYDINLLWERIMFPVEKKAVLSDLAREIKGYRISNSGGSFGKLFDNNALEKIIENTWTKLWTKFTTFGTFGAGVLFLIFIYQIIKGVIEIVLQGYALHSIFGWSLHLLGALWGSLTHFLIHMADTPKQTREELDRELEEIVIKTTTTNPVAVQAESSMNRKEEMYPSSELNQIKSGKISKF